MLPTDRQMLDKTKFLIGAKKMELKTSNIAGKETKNAENRLKLYSKFLF